MALPNILTISFRPQHLPHPVLDRLRAVTQGSATLAVLPVADSYHTLPSPCELLAPYDAVFILGSSRLFFDGSCGGPCDETRAVRDALHPALTHILERDIPTFAFCFGHQLLAHCAGGSVTACTRTAKVGTFPVHITDAGLVDPLFVHMPPTFSAHYAHHDVVGTLPDAATVLATSDTCDHALVRYGSRVYASQFHPELDARTARTLVAESPAYQQSHIQKRDFIDTTESEDLVSRFVTAL